MNKTCNKSVFPWLGGKRLLAKRIVNEMPEHSCYVEVCAGGASVFFRKNPSAVEVINDINKELITFYRVVQNHFEELCRHVQHLLVSRDEFARLQTIPPETMTDIQRAVRFLYTIKCCFGGKYKAATFGISKVERPRLNTDTLKEALQAAYNRLAKVYIECLPYGELIPRYDSSKALFYIDPPYYKMENYYGKDIFSREDFGKLRALLGNIKGNFIMSINDVDEIRELFADFRIKELKTTYSVGTNNKPAGELLIMNY